MIEALTSVIVVLQLLALVNSVVTLVVLHLVLKACRRMRNLSDVQRDIINHLHIGDLSD